MKPDTSAGLSRRQLLAAVAGIGLAGLRATQAADSAARWPDQRRSGPFLCHADFPLEAYDDLLDQTAQLQQDLCQQLGVRPAGEWIYLFWFQHKATYRSYVRHYFPGVPYRRALFIKQRGPGMVFAYQNSDFATDVRHECTHALLHAALPLVPLWLDEGIAEYFELTPAERTHGHAHQTVVQWKARLGQVPALEELERVSDLKDMGRRQYRDAWAWVHFLLHGPPAAREELQAFLLDIQAHTPPGQLSRRLHRRLPALEEHYLAHWRQWR